MDNDLASAISSEVAKGVASQTDDDDDDDDSTSSLLLLLLLLDDDNIMHRIDDMPKMELECCRRSLWAVQGWLMRR